jgi:spore photoproduct lyase
VRDAGYPLGFPIAPVVVRSGWERSYGGPIDRLEELLGDDPDISFEITTHRCRLKTKRLILARYREGGPPVDEGERRLKYAQCGYGRYRHPAAAVRRLGEFSRQRLARRWAPQRVPCVV